MNVVYPHYSISGRIKKQASHKLITSTSNRIIKKYARRKGRTDFVNIYWANLKEESGYRYSGIPYHRW